MKRYLLTLALTPLLLLFACQPAEQDAVEGEADTLAAAADAEMQDFRMEVEESLSQIDMQLDSLETWAENAEADAAEEMDSTVASLREQRDAVEQNMQQLGTAGETGFEDARADIESELDELEQDVQDAWTRYGQDGTMDSDAT